MSQHSLTFSCGDLSLEGIWHMPQGEGPFPAIVVCHPHPLYGGDMANNVVLAISQALAAESIASLRFNFRGVGGSQGTFGRGITEQDDVRAALTLVSSLEKVVPERIGLAGYSFGAQVALPVALEHEKVQALALVSPPLSPSDWEQLKTCGKPKLLLYGSSDQIVFNEKVGHLSLELPEPKQFEVIPGADHFWWGYEQQMALKVASFLAKALSQASKGGAEEK